MIDITKYAEKKQEANKALTEIAIQLNDLINSLERIVKVVDTDWNEIDIWFDVNDRGELMLVQQ